MPPVLCSLPTDMIQPDSASPGRRWATPFANMLAQPKRTRHPFAQLLQNARDYHELPAPAGGGWHLEPACKTGIFLLAAKKLLVIDVVVLLAGVR